YCRGLVGGRCRALTRLWTRASGVGDEADRALKEPRQRARWSNLRERRCLLDTLGAIKVACEARRVTRRLPERPPHAEHDGPAEKRQQSEDDENDLRHQGRIH